MHCYFLKIDACDASKIYIKKTLFSRFKKFVGIFFTIDNTLEYLVKRYLHCSWWKFGVCFTI